MPVAKRIITAMAVVAASASILSACSSSSNGGSGGGSAASNTAAASAPSSASSSGAASGATAANAAATGGGTIAFIPGATGVGFYNSLKSGAQAEATKLGYKFLYQGSPNFTPSAQTPIVNAVCTKHPKLLLIAPTDPAALRPAIQTCMNEGVKVVTVDTGLTNTQGIVSAISSNNLQGGAAAADLIGAKLNGKGRVGTLSLSATATTQVQRVKGLTQELAKKYPGISVTSQYSGQAESTSITQAKAMLSAHPDIKAFFGAGEPNAEGAAQAVASLGKSNQMTIVGYDADPSEVALLKKGSISALVIQQPAQEGKLGVDYGVDALTGKTSQIKKSVLLDNIVVTTAQSNDPNYTKYYYAAS